MLQWATGWELARGGQNVSCDFGGGGGKRTIKCPPPKPVLEASENGIHKGGGDETYHKWGGPKPFLGRGFMVCFPLPWVFFPPLVFLWTGVLIYGTGHRSMDGVMCCGSSHGWGHLFLCHSLCGSQRWGHRCDSGVTPFREGLHVFKLFFTGGICGFPGLVYYEARNDYQRVPNAALANAALVFWI